MKRENISSELNWFLNANRKVVNDQNLPRISLITPSFNQGKYIEQTILSVINQNYPNLEYIIIDGGSTDETVEIIKKYEKHLKYWISEKDKGQTDALNKGFEQVTGDIFNWINSDDLLAENALWKIGEFFRDHPGISCYAGKEIRFLENERINHSFGTSIENSLEESILKSHIDQPSTFFRTASIRPVFPLEISLKYCMDNQMWLNYLIRNGQKSIESSNEILAFFRYHDDSKTFIHAPKFKFELILLLKELDTKLNGGRSVFFKEIKQEIDKIYFHDKLSSWTKQYESDDSFIFREAASYYKYMGLKKPALYFSREALKKRPLKWINHKYYWSIRLK